MTNRNYTQQGMTFPGFILTVFLTVFFFTLLFKIGPIYTEHSTIKSAMSFIKDQPDIATNSREVIADLLRKQLSVNNVSIITSHNIAVTKHGSYVKIQITYDHTVPLYGNLDVVAHFDDIVEVGSEESGD